MFYQTDLAIRQRIESMDFSPYSPMITGFIPEEHVRPNESGRYTLPSIGISHYSIDQNLSLWRDCDIVLSYEDESAILVKYPQSWVIGYQIDIRSSQKRADAQFEANRILEQFLRPPPTGFAPGANLDVSWTFGGYSISGKVPVSLAESPKFLGDEGDGRRRISVRLDAYTWLFSETTPRSVGRIKYRIMELADMDAFDTVFKTEDPDGFYS